MEPEGSKGTQSNGAGAEVRPAAALAFNRANAAFRDGNWTEDAATKLIYLAIRNFEKGGRNVR